MTRLINWLLSFFRRPGDEPVPLKQLTITKSQSYYIPIPDPLTQRSKRPIRIYNRTADTIEIRFLGNDDPNGKTPFTKTGRYILSDGEIKTFTVRDHGGSQTRYKYEITCVKPAPEAVSPSLEVDVAGQTSPEAVPETSTQVMALALKNPEMIID